ncbi:MAG: porin, partial [Rhizobiaceae bacterium]
GTGFFYIPGTETCIRASGYVRYRMDFDSRLQYATHQVRGRLNFDTRSETEWGTLQSYLRLQSQWDPQNQLLRVRAPVGGGTVGWGNLGTDGLTSIDQAWIAIGGLFMGYTESFYVDSRSGGASNLGSFSDTGLNYANQQRNLIGYRFESNGFFGTLSLEDDGNSNFIPDVVGKIGYKSGAFTVWAKAAYDEDIAPASAAWLGARAAGLSNIDGWSAQLGTQIDFPNMNGSALRLIGWYSSNANAYNVGATWAVTASYKHVFSKKLWATVGAQYLYDTNFAAAGRPTAWLVEGAIVVTPVKDLELRGEIYHNTATRATTGMAWVQRSF